MARRLAYTRIHRNSRIVSWRSFTRDSRWELRGSLLPTSSCMLASGGFAALITIVCTMAARTCFHFRVVGRHAAALRLREQEPKRIGLRSPAAAWRADICRTHLHMPANGRCNERATRRDRSYFKRAKSAAYEPSSTVEDPDLRPLSFGMSASIERSRTTIAMGWKTDACDRVLNGSQCILNCRKSDCPEMAQFRTLQHFWRRDGRLNSEAD